MKLTRWIILFIFFLNHISASTVTNKTTQAINLFLENQEDVQKLNENLPADFYLALLGLNLPSIGTLETKLKTTLLYIASLQALNVARNNLINFNKCSNTLENSFNESLKFSNIEELAKNCPPGESEILNNACKVNLLLCKNKLSDNSSNYKMILEFMRKFNRQKFLLGDEASLNFLNPHLEFQSFIDSTKRSCELGLVSKKIAIEIENSCKEFAEILKNEQIRSVEKFDTQNCFYKKINPKEPLFYTNSGRCSNGYFSLGENFIGLKNNDLELLLMIARTRSFYWLKFAEYFYEQQKENLVRKDDSVDLKLSESFLKTSADRDLFFKKIQTYSIAGKIHVGNRVKIDKLLQIIKWYNKDKRLSDTDKLEIINLTNRLDGFRADVSLLKQEVKSLMSNGPLKVSFELEHFL